MVDHTACRNSWTHHHVVKILDLLMDLHIPDHIKMMITYVEQRVTWKAGSRRRKIASQTQGRAEGRITQGLGLAGRDNVLHRCRLLGMDGVHKWKKYQKLVAYRLQDGKEKVLHQSKVAGVMEKYGEKARNARLLCKHKAGRKAALCRLADCRDKIPQRCRLLGMDEVHKWKKDRKLAAYRLQDGREEVLHQC